MKVLLLAGTAEARALSFALAERGVDCVASLAGLTNRPAQLAGTVRIGGFGGVAGLVRYLRAEKISHMVDATHPFAVAMSAHAEQAAEQAGVPLLRLDRPAWPMEPNWTMVPDMAAAAAALPPGVRVFLATGRGSVDAFKDRRDVALVVRVIEDDPGPAPWPHMEFVAARPPFTGEEERATLQQLRVDMLVSRNSGGKGGTEKLRAAADLKLPVVMVARPPVGKAEAVAETGAVLDWIGRMR